ncbi:hypothetical protein [Methanothrix soehngenii]|uniref:hypothetical protein n=1 Tax=Methanothrix soehngenii TaxID=2223 RepID=UPI00300D8349
MKDINPELVAAASEVLKSGSCKVYKSTRAGFTTSVVLAAMEAKKPILVLEPHQQDPLRDRDESQQGTSYHRPS